MFPMHEEKSLFERIEEKGAFAVFAAEAAVTMAFVFLFFLAGCR